MSSISVTHQAAGLATPTSDIVVHSTWSGIRRTNGVAQTAKSALLTDDIWAMITTLPDTLLGKRDVCLLLLGFASALRRSELVALDVCELVETNDGLVVTVTRSKTDQEGEGRQIGLPYGSDPTTCPVRTHRDWIQASRSKTDRCSDPSTVTGTSERHDSLIALVAIIVKRTAQAAGLDPKLVAGHSLRSGMATSAARAGATEAQIMNQTGHKSLPVLRRYIRRGSLFNDNAAAKLGL